MTGVQTCALPISKDEARPNVRDVMTQLHKLNKETVLLTGDHWSTAKNLANDVDIKRVFAETKSNSRARIIRKLQFEGETVVMVGDGINDATAIAQADAGIAIGMPNDIAADAADIVLLNNDLRQLLTTIRLANKTIRNMKENLFLVFFYNLLMLPLASGILYLLGINFLIDPMLSSIAMFLGFISVIINALRLNKFK